MRPGKRAAPAPDTGQLTVFTEIHRADERRFSTWRNGGGQTAEILCHPDGAGFDDFGWRISTAQVAASGPFSIFPDVTRSLTVITGGQLCLVFPDGRTALLDDRSSPFVFPGDISCDCTLIGPAVLDLNVLVRPPFACTVTRGSTGEETGLRFVFALRDLPAQGLYAHDLGRLLDAAPSPVLTREDAVMVTISAD
ncbi:MAG: HutD family protein [Paracoccus denitrificans]|uniref:HutD family protein n=1 Tax=Paracoccus denitrificans TaxID=266 RepID=A0A533ID13_PARDE|nr:MAG: HutD family protein [Paracoccus denitrificans]